MNSTTGDNRVSWPRVLALSLALQAAGAAVFCALDPLHTTRLEAPPQEVRRVDRDVAQRWRQKERERETNRADLQLPSRDAGRMARRREQEAAATIRERLNDMERIRDDLKASAAARMKDLHSRDAADVGQHLHERLLPLATQLVANARTQADQAPQPAAPSVQQASEALLSTVQQAGEQAMEPQWASALEAAHAELQARQLDYIRQLEAAQAAYPADAERLRLENHVAYGVNLMRDRISELVALARSLDPATLNDLPPGRPATEPPQGMAGASSATSVANLHQHAVAVFHELQQEFVTTRAADFAIEHRTSLAAAMDRMQLPASAAAPLPASDGVPRTVGELKTLSATFEGAVQEVQRLWQSAYNMGMAGRAMAGRAATPGDSEGGGPPGSPDGPASGRGPAAAAGVGPGTRASRAAAYRTSGRYADLTPFMVHRGPGEQAFGGGAGGGRDATHRVQRSGSGSALATAPEGLLEAPLLEEDRVIREALPGRIFSPNSPRTGWLYIDTWYLIGPWDNQARLDFAQTFPPETLVDLDAEYTGKNGQRLFWQFHQSDNIRVKPEAEQEHSTYYGYTEVYFEEETAMLLAVASDDAAKVWLNGFQVWEDDGLSPWRLDEGFRNVVFRKGFNTLLLRIDNGPITCTFSLLLCPPDILAPGVAGGRRGA